MQQNNFRAMRLTLMLPLAGARRLQSQRAQTMKVAPLDSEI
jgi:hypothetical protein